MDLDAKRIYFFGEGVKEDVALLGRKGVQLCDLRSLQLPVPVGFIISTMACNEYLKQDNGDHLSTFLIEDCAQAMVELETTTNRKFGKSKLSRTDRSLPFLQKDRQQLQSTSNLLTTPLLLSLRSAECNSSESGFNAILGLGMNDTVAEMLIEQTGNPSWVYDTYCRFLKDFGSRVLNIEESKYELILQKERVDGGVETNAALSEVSLLSVVKQFQRFTDVPADPWEQLLMAIRVSFMLANSAMVRDGGAGKKGVALIVQSMVFGNFDESSGCGIAYSRNPVSGEKRMCGEYLLKAQGNQVDSESTAYPAIEQMQCENPALYATIHAVLQRLEAHYHDMQEVEFTFQSGQLFVLNAHDGRRSLRASVKVLVDLVEEGLIDEREAVMRITAPHMDMFLKRAVSSLYGEDVLPMLIDCGKVGSGRAVGDGVLKGKCVFSAQDAEEYRARGEPCVLCTDVDNEEAYSAASGIIATHQPKRDLLEAVRRDKKIAIVGVRDMVLDTQAETLVGRLGVLVLKRDDDVVVDTATASIYRCDVPTNSLSDNPSFQTLMQWADRYKRMLVKVAARTMDDIFTARAQGADGIILFSLEKFLPETPMYGEVLVSRCWDDKEDESSRPFTTPLPVYRALVNIFRVLDWERVTFRLCGDDPDVSPCTLPVLTSHVNAILAAVVEARKMGIIVTPCILVPDFHQAHTPTIVKLVRKAFTPLMVASYAAAGQASECEIGVIIERVQGCRDAGQLVVSGSMYLDCVAFDTDKIAADFFDSSGEAQQLQPSDRWKHSVLAEKYPLKQSSGRNEVSCLGDLMQDAVTLCKQANPDVMTIVTGEHCGDLESIRYFNWLGVNSIVCPPDKIPITKFAAAQSAIRKLNTSHIPLVQTN